MATSQQTLRRFHDQIASEDSRYPANACTLLAYHDDRHEVRRRALGVAEDDLPTDADDPAAPPIGRSGKQQLKNYAAVAARLPAPGIVFQLEDAHFGFSEGDIRKLRNERLILVVGEEYRRPARKAVNVYGTNPVAWQFMREFGAEQPSFECCWLGTGWDNPRGSEGYRCATCGAPKTRAEVEEVFF